MLFDDRHHAGKRLAQALEQYRGKNPIVLGLARGGVVVGHEVARALDAPLDVQLVRKLGAPGTEEFAIGAMAPGATLLRQELVAGLGISQDYLARVIVREADEMARRERAYRGNRPPIEVKGRTVILVDDGLAAGATAQAAVESVRRRHPKQIVFAAPVCSAEGAAELERVADAVVCLDCPLHFGAVGNWYRNFSPTTDAEVIQCLRSTGSRRVSA